jgi:agmatinase
VAGASLRGNELTRKARTCDDGTADRLTANPAVLRRSNLHAPAAGHQSRRSRRSNHRSAVRFRRPLPHRRALRAECHKGNRGDINIFETQATADVGDAAVVPGYEEESLAALEESVRTLIDANVTPFAIGGDHSVTLAELRAVASRFGPLALIQFDSHTDTWDSYFGGKRYSAGTPFRRAVEEELVTPAHSIQIGMRGSLFQVTDISQSLTLGYDVLTCDQFFEIGVQAVADRIAARTAGRPCFITFDMDFVDPGSAPGVQTPESGGPTSRETLLVLRRLHDLHLVGCDVVEMNPLYDDPGQTTALLAATVMAELLALSASDKQ